MLVRINKLSEKTKFIYTPFPGKVEHDGRSQNIVFNLSVTSAVNSGSNSKAKGGGIGTSLFVGASSKLTWQKTLPLLAKHTSLPFVLKGIQTHKDAFLASLYAP